MCSVATVVAVHANSLYRKCYVCCTAMASSLGAVV